MSVVAGIPFLPTASTTAPSKPRGTTAEAAEIIASFRIPQLEKGRQESADDVADIVLRLHGTDHRLAPLLEIMAGPILEDRRVAVARIIRRLRDA